VQLPAVVTVPCKDDTYLARHGCRKRVRQVKSTGLL